jgi:hypothetical protein
MGAKKIHRTKPHFGTGIPKPDDIGGFTPWEEVTRVHNETSGLKPISEARVKQIAADAEVKFHEAMARYARELWYEKK